MDDAALAEEFNRVCAVAVQIDSQTDSITEFEPQLVQLLNLTRQMTRSAAVARFVALIRGEVEAPIETVPFCMHALRFPEIRDEATRLVGAPPNPQQMNYVSAILHAYEDDWEDKDFWSYFRRATEAR